MCNCPYVINRRLTYKLDDVNKLTKQKTAPEQFNSGLEVWGEKGASGEVGGGVDILRLVFTSDVIISANNIHVTDALKC